MNWVYLGGSEDFRWNKVSKDNAQHRLLEKSEEHDRVLHTLVCFTSMFTRTEKRSLSKKRETIFFLRENRETKNGGEISAQRVYL